jgi:glycosidase
MKNKKTNTDATVREDFPGGWKDDPTTRFTAAGRNERENEAFHFVSRLANFRKRSSALTGGKTMQFIPRDGLYIYFRYDAKQTVMVVTHGGDKPAKPDWNLFAERTKGFTRVKDVISGTVRNLDGLEFQPKESFVFELVK